MEAQVSEDNSRCFHKVNGSLYDVFILSFFANGRVVEMICCFHYCYRDESGICALHVIRQYDGDKMMWPLTQARVFAFFLFEFSVK